ncbi:hypothetical protein [Polaromonas sp. CG_9.11]|uniref:hypothetical protein n=1 Tax=Polaromonas sp. CG_9.11 TaxID=2787730 RepID=UPI0005640E2A|nr:hypothetical protein [Polaromonas sp. CG_9.11]MBG6076988.1 hypothetical protein [Polaromonas sp. CG_9.11]
MNGLRPAHRTHETRHGLLFIVCGGMASFHLDAVANAGMVSTAFDNSPAGAAYGIDVTPVTLAAIRAPG